MSIWPKVINLRRPPHDPQPLPADECRNRRDDRGIADDQEFVLVPEAPFKFDTGQFVELTLAGGGRGPLHTFLVARCRGADGDHHHEGWSRHGAAPSVARASAWVCAALRQGLSHRRVRGQARLHRRWRCGFGPIRSLFLTLVEPHRGFQSVRLPVRSEDAEDSSTEDLFGDWQKTPGRGNEADGG